MSVVLTYSVPNDLSQLHDELLRAAAAAGPPADVDNVPERVEGLGDDITLTMPDAVDEPAIDALVAAHVPQARYDPATRLAEVAALRRAGGRAALLARTRAAATVADLRAALLEHLREEAEAG